MTKSLRKIKVFISSRCTDDYAAVRRALYDRLDESGVFAPLMFEEHGADPASPKEYYLRELRSSDVCLFIIGGEEGLSEGVLEEVEAARKYKKNSFFYLCGFESEASLQKLQQCIPKANMPVYQTQLSSLSDVPEKAIGDLQNNIMEVYGGYCDKFYVADLDEKDPANRDMLVSVDNARLPKQVLIGLNATTGIFEKFILNRHEEERGPSTDLDAYSADLAERIFFTGRVNEFEYEHFIETVESLVGDQYDKELAELRWRSIRAFYRQDFREAFSHQEQAYQRAVTAGSPDWLIKDILIDLRNIETIIRPFTYNYQKVLDESETALSYPLLDRAETEFYGALAKSEKRGLQDSIYTITIGSNLNELVSKLARTLLVAAIYGSLTHLRLICDRLETLALHLCNKYGYDQFGSLLFELLLRTGDHKKIEGTIQSIGSVAEFDSSEEASEICRRVFDCASPNNRSTVIAETFLHLGCYLNEADFTTISAEFMTEANRLDRGATRNEAAEASMLSAIRTNSGRLSQQWVLGRCIKALTSYGPEARKEALKVVSCGGLEFGAFNQDDLTRLIEAIVEAVNAVKAFLSFDAALSLATIANARKELLAKCERAANDVLDEDSISIFLIEIRTSERDFIIHQIESHIERAEQDNVIQGQNGCWALGGSNAYKNATHLFSLVENPPSCLIARAAKAAEETLTAETQLLEAKSDACLFLLDLMSLPSVASANDLGIEWHKLTEIDYSDMPRSLVGGNESLLSFSICFEALRYCAGGVNSKKLQDLLFETYNARGFDQARAASALSRMLKAVDKQDIDASFMGFLYAYSGALYSSPLFQVRIEAIDLLFAMLALEKVASDVACWLVESYDEKTPNEKCRIVRHQAKIKCVNKEAWEKLRRKSLRDVCLIPRHVAEELFIQTERE